jgi:hypothetical protein
MATLLLEVEVDSEAHPELYVALGRVARSELRCERLRQLATGGFIAESTRQHASMVQPGGAPPLSGAESEGRLPTRSSSAVDSPVRTQDAPGASVTAQHVESALRRTAPEVAVERSSLLSVSGERQPWRSLPVLQDVVAEGLPRHGVGAEEQPAPESPARSRLRRMRASGLFSND